MHDLCRQTEPLLSAYALGVLDPQDRRLVETHLQVCESCEAQLESYRVVAEGLLHIVPPVQPPPGIRANLIARLAGRTERVPWHMQLFARLRAHWAPLLAVLVLVVVNFGLVGQIRQISSAQQALELQVAQDRLALSLVSYPTVQKAMLEGDGAYGSFLFEPELDIALLSLWYLEPLPADQAYQVWLIEPDGDRVSGGVFTVSDPEELVRLVIDVHIPLGTFIGMGVTIEPSGGSPAPTGPRVVGAEL